MPATPYIPATDAAFDAWTQNFATLLTATPIAYGLIAADATIVQGVVDTFHDSYGIASNPSTRTAPAIAQKDSDRAVCDSTIRPYAQTIAKNAGVSDMLKVGIGLNLPNATRPRIPAPLTNPDLTHVQSNPGVTVLGYHDSTTPLSKAKPTGVSGMELRRAIGVAAATDPDAATFLEVVTKSPISVPNDSGDAGKVATYFARWRTKSGSGGISYTGPWSPALAVTLL